MDDKIQKEMMLYYHERSEEYDELYRGVCGGRRHVTINPQTYQQDVVKTSEMVSKFGTGHLIDIGCGPGFWLLYYARNCNRITLIDQSEKMLQECSKRVEELGLVEFVNFIHGDFFEIQLLPSIFDCALIGFLLSHFFTKQEEEFFLKLQRILKPNSQLLIIDSAWNEERKQYRKKEGVQKRVLNDGRVFKIYKRYFEKLDIEKMSGKYNFEIKSCYVGKAMISTIVECL
jgi:ubiquinone/menaquinone biosynthesis C-methylase UbiE